MNRRPGRLGRRTGYRELRAAAGAPLPLRPDSGPIGPQRPVKPIDSGRYMPGFDEGDALFLRRYVLETARLRSANAYRRGFSRTLAALTRNVQQMSGWEALAMKVVPN
jgi:hypothetical protein